LAGVKVSRHITVAHSVEMAGRDKIELLDVENLQEVNGSIGNSSSATAYFASQIKPGDKQALHYLNQIVNTHNGGASTLAPFETFERIWTLWNLSLANLENKSQEVNTLFQEHLDYLNNHWSPGKGLGFSKTYSLTDSDDTAVGFELLTKFGKQNDIEALLEYEEEKWFRCFQFEINPSVDVNIHALGALRQAGYDKKHPTINKIVSFLRSQRIAGNYWFDKWHVSPYYTTAHAVIYCKDYDEKLCQDSINWILSTQKSDGSWGFYNFSTAEETAYCIQAIQVWKKFGKKIPKERIELAKNWLLKNAEAPYPPLWIDKSLYCPELLVRSAILSALELAQE